VANSAQAEAAPASLAFSPTVARYVPVLEALRPGCDDEERRHRCGILYLRDRAAAGRRRASWEADQVLATIESLATVHGFRSMTIGQLDLLRRSLIGLMSIATMLETDGPRAEMADG
jgi:hypothetical protein